MIRFLLALTLAAAPALAWAQYKCKDERGRWQYVSLPRPGCADMSGKPVEAPKAAAPAAAAKGAPKYALPGTARKAKSAPKPAAKKETVIGALPANPSQRKVDCRGLQQQYDWLMSPAGRGTEMHAARVSQVKQAMRGC